jgi:adenosylcobyric acid synthase
MRKDFASPETLMVQGTTSDAGKSVLVAGLCRLLSNRGINVAPFKPQNMALNSAVTVDGGEIGRSQALQAQASRQPPHTDFNPILLKPSSDTGAQVIIHGHAIEPMEAGQYHNYKKVAMSAVLESHNRLKNSYEKIIVEGAGSPAEINLRENDIANMGFAEAVDCPVILIADIDRGGVFAHLVGTLDLLSESEQQRVTGFVINRFRGDIKLLESGLDWLEKRTGKPVLAVLPYLQNFYLDAEDAINTSQTQSSSEQLKIVVPVLPRISNHTDFDVLRLHPQADLKFVNIEQPCPACDLIILPGSKNVRADLQALKESGWTEQLLKHIRYGGKVIGICGGYQMLGNEIHDPDGIEDTAGSTEGFKLLNLQTTLQPKKQLKNVSGTLTHPALKRAAFNGYEIHCGTTETTSAPVLEMDGRTDGSMNRDNNVLGTYIHGIFDNANAADSLLNWAGLKGVQTVDIEEIREQQLERLAGTLEEHFDHGFLESLLAVPKIAK